MSKDTRETEGVKDLPRYGRPKLKDDTKIIALITLLESFQATKTQIRFSNILALKY